jgi:hypothetical protein
MIIENIEEDQLQIGKDMRVELQIPPSLHLYFNGSEKSLRPEGGLFDFIFNG